MRNCFHLQQSSNVSWSATGLPASQKRTAVWTVSFHWPWGCQREPFLNELWKPQWKLVWNAPNQLSPVLVNSENHGVFCGFGSKAGMFLRFWTQWLFASIKSVCEKERTKKWDMETPRLKKEPSFSPLTRVRGWGGGQAGKGRKRVCLSWRAALFLKVLTGTGATFGHLQEQSCTQTKLLWFAPGDMGTKLRGPGSEHPICRVMIFDRSVPSPSR